MANDDEAARQARANALRQRIAALKSGPTKPEDSEDKAKPQGTGSDQKPADDTTPAGESPREFIYRRMRELDHDKRKRRI